MVFKYHILCLAFYLFKLYLVFFNFIHPVPAYSAAAAATTSTSIQPTKLVEAVCRATSSYAFCVESLYADPRTSSADRYVLAYISFGMTYLNASGTQEHIAKLLKHGQGQRPGAGYTRQQLRRCYHDYDKVVSALQVAYGDLDSETFSELADLAGVASVAADDCQASLKKRTESSLTTMNHDLKSLCEICIVVSKLFTGLAF